MKAPRLMFACRVSYTYTGSPYLYSTLLALIYLLLPLVLTAQWTSQTTPTLLALNAVYFPNATEGWAVGETGTILYSNDTGVNWVSQTSGTMQRRGSVFFMDANNGFAVGDKAYISFTQDAGSSWSSFQFTGLSGPFFHDVHFPSSSVGYICGGNGKVLKTTNGGTGGMSSWTSINIGETSRFRTVFFVTDQKGWLAGNGGKIKYTSNGGNNVASWSNQTSGTTQDLHCLYFLDANTGWVVGDGGVIRKTTDGGATWEVQTSGVTTLLKSVDFIDANNGWIVGFGGTILRTEDGGDTWYPQSADVSVDFYGVSAITDQIAVAVGDGGTVIKTTNGGGMLPIEWTSFQVELAPGGAKLSWETATELNNEGFEIQWQTENCQWQKIAFIPGQGTTSRPNQYNFIHADPLNGNNYYRLKQLDFDGGFSYSSVKSVQVVTTVHNLKIMPNPVKNGFIRCQLPSTQAHEIVYEIYTVSGQCLTHDIISTESAQEFKIDVGGLPEGVSYLKCFDGNQVYVGKIIVE